MKTRRMKFTRFQYTDMDGDTQMGDEYIGPKRFRHPEICVDLLGEFVAIPKDTKTIVVIGHTQPAKDRMEIEAMGGNDLIIDGEETMMYSDTGLLAERWIKTGHKYISIQY